MGFLWELFQQSQLQGVADEVDETRLLAGEGNATAQMLIADLQAMQQRVHHLERCNDALWVLLKERLQLTDDDLVRRLRGPTATAITDTAPPVGERRNCIKCGSKRVPQMDHSQICGEHVTA